VSLTEIRNSLQNPADEADRLGAFGTLQAYLNGNPDDIEAQKLYAEFSFTPAVDWTKLVVSS